MSSSNLDKYICQRFITINNCYTHNYKQDTKYRMISDLVVMHEY